jgi:threonylcarbamoyladenosine tRNA methylthiotransferase MtaB
MMNAFSIKTLGCKVNQYESQQIREFLEKLGLHMAEPPSKPNVIVVNTCCVTHTASAKSRHYIRQAQKQYPDALIIVSGCLPIVPIGELNIPTKNVHVIRDRRELTRELSRLVRDHVAAAAKPLWRRRAAATVAPSSQSAFAGTITPSAKDSCPNIPIKAQNGFKIKYKNDLCNNDLELPPLTSFKEQTRAFLKIQDGCDGYCSYCIVPKTRPFVHSKPVDAVVREAQTLVESGHKEIVITGVFLGAYGQHTVRRRSWPHQHNDHLADLLDRIAQIPNLARIRLSSLEPGDVTDRLLDTLCANPNIMPHLHLALQSGSDVVLKKMCRQYGADEFRQKVESIKSRLDRPAITTDIIVGFPGETDADFQQTADLANDVGFAKIHVFRYSPRPGTPIYIGTARTNNKVDRKVVRERSERLRGLATESGRRYRRQFLGETADILIEDDAPPVRGRSERYFMVDLDSHRTSNIQKNDLVRVKLAENRDNGMIGTTLNRD